MNGCTVKCPPVRSTREDHWRGWGWRDDRQVKKGWRYVQAVLLQNVIAVCII